MVASAGTNVCSHHQPAGRHRGRSRAVVASATGGRSYLTMSMTSLSVSLPQTFDLQPKISALATATPCLKVFPPDACTRTVTCWPDPVQPTLVNPNPWATPDPDFWVTLTWRSANVALQVTSSGTSTAAPGPPAWPGARPGRPGTA